MNKEPETQSIVESIPADRALLLMVDVVLLTLLEGRLHVGLALRRQQNEPFYGAWCLPGGFVRPQEDVDAKATAKRVLREKAGVESPYLEQLVTMSGNARDPRGWSASIVYYALVPGHIAPWNSEQFIWEAIDDIIERTLPFDHSEILRTAVARVRNKASYSALPIYLMPEIFTLSELRKVYEQLLGGPLDPRSFARRIEDLNVLEDTGQVKAESHRPARLYKAINHFSISHLGSSFIAR